MVQVERVSSLFSPCKESVCKLTSWQYMCSGEMVDDANDKQ